MSKEKKNLLASEDLKARLEAAKKELQKPKEEKIKDQEKVVVTEAVDKIAIKPKLYVAGRLNRKENNYIPKSFHILERFEKDLKNYCKGNDLAVLNYLLSIGLKTVKDSNEIINIDVTDIERL